MTWVRADFHLHTAEDPFDAVDHTALELLERAHLLGFGALAVTLHDKVFDDESAFARARELGILLIQAAELRIEDADVVLLNITPAEADRVHSFEDLRRLRAARGESLLCFAPHPFYRIGGSIGKRIEDYLDCFDAIEFCHFHIPLLDPNVPAVRLAKRHHKPLLATSDAHRSHFFGTNYSLLGVQGATTVESAFAAIRADRIRRVSPSGGLPRFAALLFFIFVLHPILRRVLKPGAPKRIGRPLPVPASREIKTPA